MNKRRSKSQRGVGIVENLVAMALVAIAVVGSTSLFITCFHSNASTRTYTSVIADVQSIVDSYRNGSYADLLGRFGTSYVNIANGQQATLSSESADSRAAYTTTFTAIKTSPGSIPEAVRVRVAATHRRGNPGDVVYDFETIIAQVN